MYLNEGGVDVDDGKKDWFEDIWSRALRLADYEIDDHMGMSAQYSANEFDSELGPPSMPGNATNSLLLEEYMAKASGYQTALIVGGVGLLVAVVAYKAFK